jgi:hypothetical protein
MFIRYPVPKWAGFFVDNGGSRMKHGWFLAGITGMIILSLLSGYAGSNPIKPAIQQAVSSQESASQPVVQNRKERQLVLLFQALLQMDRKEGLSISKEQAAALLPLIRNSRDQGNLTANQLKQALEHLNVDQQTFYNDFAKKMQARLNGVANINIDHLTQEERDKLIEQFKEKRNLEPPNTANRSEGEGPSGQGLGKSMEQQLIELLEAKAKL